MAEYTTATTMELGADVVFARIADLDTLSSYLPAVRHATFVGREELLVTLSTGEATGAWLRVYRDSRQLLWGTDDGGYRGELHVVPRLDDPVEGEPGDVEPGEGARCSLTVTVRSDQAGETELARLTEHTLAALARAAGRGPPEGTPAARGL